MATVDVLFQGFPGRSPTYGRLGWVSLALVRSGGKNVLVDTGHNGVHRLLVQRLAERGVTRDDIDILVISHTHWDHCLGFHLFPRAEIVVGQAEMEWATKLGPGEDMSVPTYFVEALAKHPRLRMVKGDTKLLPGVMTIDTPGHTPGHISLVASTDRGEVVVGQDAVKNRAEFLSRKADQTMDDAASTASIERIASIASVVVPGHDRVFRVEDGQARYEGDLQVELYAKAGTSLEEKTVFSITFQ